jgi:ABC-type polysaccharide/polyol phosphate export permease
MFERKTVRTPLQAALAMGDVVFHAAVRNVRRSHGNAVVGLLMNIFQTVMLVAVFYLMFELLGMRGTVIRGDYLLYIMSGIFVFITHVKTLGAVAGSDGPTSPMMKHATMNTLVATVAAALGALYQQVFSAAVLLFVYHAAVTPITFQHPVAAFSMFLLAWVSGAALGMVLQAAKPWWPEAVSIVTQIYSRANVILSGKMFVANMMPGYMLQFFDWNPLFHIIDQGRGFIFLNYNPHYSSIWYPVACTLAFLMVGLIADFYTYRFASASWSAGK